MAINGMHLTRVGKSDEVHAMVQVNPFVLENGANNGVEHSV
jgi:hypothetical protein